VSNGTRRSAQASTCFAVLLLSFMLVLSPSWHPMLSPNAPDNNSDAQSLLAGANLNDMQKPAAIGAPADALDAIAQMNPAVMPGRSRTLMSALIDEEVAKDGNNNKHMTYESRKRPQLIEDLDVLAPAWKRANIPVKIEEIDEDEPIYYQYQTATRSALVNHTKKDPTAYDF